MIMLIFVPESGMQFLAWISLVPLFLVIRRSSMMKTFIFSVITGFVFFSGFLSWLLKVDGVNPFNFALAMLCHAFYTGLFGVFAHFFQKRIPLWNLLTFPASWVIITEYLRSHMGFLSSPWGILGYSQYNVLSVAGLSSFTGVYGVSFLIVAINTVLAEIIFSIITADSKTSQWASIKGLQKVSFSNYIAVLIFIPVILFSGALSASNVNSQAGLKVALIQGNAFWDEKRKPEYRNVIFETYQNLTRLSARSGPELIAWPASTVPGGIPYDTVFVRMLSDLAQSSGSFLLVGASGYDKFNVKQRHGKMASNSAFLFSPQGEIIGRYDKIRLLPFDEYLPLRGYLKWPSWIANSDMVDFQPGREMTVFRTGRLSFAAQDCWENLFPDQFRKISGKGVDFMVSMTNEAFTDAPTAHYQMMAMNVFRAIENHVSIIRTAATGVTCIIEPNGKITAKVKDEHSKDVNIEGYLIGQIPLSQKRTFYNRHGDWFVYSLSLLLIGFFLLTGFQKQKNDGSI